MIFHLSPFVPLFFYYNVINISVKRGFNVIIYDSFWKTLKSSGESTYTLIHKHNMSSATINRLRKNQPVSTTTLDDLCRILNCGVDDILSYTPGDEASDK